jgi:hypothetical protein
MPRYLVYGLSIESEWELPDLDRTLEAASACIRSGVNQVGLPLEHEAPRWFADGEHIFLTDSQVGSICVDGGREVTVHLKENPDHPLLEAYLLGPALAVVLHQRGYLVLHASVLARDGQAVAILGDSGEGKSTAALALCSRGWRLVADDQAVIEWTQEGPAVYPGRAALRVSHEALSRFGASQPGLILTAECGGKFLFRPGAPVVERTPLSCLYVLCEGAQIRCPPIPAEHVFASLIQHSFLGSLLTSTGSLARHFHQCADLAGRLPVRRLERPRSLALLDDLPGVIENDVALRLRG